MKRDYVNKMEELLSDNQTYVHLDRNPLSTVNSSNNRVIERIFFSFSKELKYKFKPITPRLPYMYGLVKTHKNNAMRPIISSVNSCSYRLSQWLSNILSPYVGTVFNAHIVNNVYLINKLKNITIDYPFTLVSFDVKSLFTNEPLEDLIDFMKDHFKECVFPVGLEDLLELIKLCVCDAKFCFNGKFYKQKFGLAMGNCLSPVCSNLYMEFFERNLLTTILPNHVKWFRYVDDVLCLWPKSMNLQSFLYDLNKFVPSIKFSVEVEQQNCLPFLDVLIIRKEDDFYLMFTESQRIFVPIFIFIRTIQ